MWAILLLSFRANFSDCESRYICHLREVKIEVTDMYAKMQWLPAPPQDFAHRLKSLGGCSEPLGEEIRRLALHALDSNHLLKLANVLRRARQQGRSLEPLIPFRLALLSNSTADLISPALEASAARHGICLEIIQPSYDQVAQEALSPHSKTNTARADAVLFALDYRGLPLRTCLGEKETASTVVSDCIIYLESLRNGIKTHSNALCIFQTFAPPPETLFGSFDVALPGTARNLIESINGKLAQLLFDSGDVLFDVAGLASVVGLSEWHDPQLWNLAKFPFAEQLIPIYAEHAARIIAAIRGKSKKALVLDLDNTVWGGVIGDDGLSGIKTAQGDAVGEAHRAVQQMALNLRQRGIVLAVSSKNHDSVACEPFLKHPEMLLKLDHFAVFQANWEDKATNIRAIAETLNLGLDSIVFLDDNPAERSLVRRLLPQVAVPELPEDPAFYARVLAAAGYFEAVSLAAEDLKRADFYMDNAKRANLKQQAGDLDAYLASLDMTITFQPFDATGRARIVQLINKSNQYNLTTRRYTEPEIAEAEQDPSVFTLQVRLVDAFGDNGMICVVICRPGDPDAWEIDTWLMSCRVLGRKVEFMVLRTILQCAHNAGIRKLIGTYKPTERNLLVADHYSRLGFTELNEDQSGFTRWELSVADAKPETAAMNVVRMGFETLVETAEG